jgi:hypothetical protein
MLLLSRGNVSAVSSLDDVESWYVPEVTEIASSDTEAELQGSGGDQKVFESDIHALFGLVAFDAARKLGYLDCDRMDWQVADELIDESLPALPPFLQLGALNAMRQFHNGYHRKTDLDFSVTGFEVFENLPYGVALALGGDDHTRIED